jgi:hypothetical protein
MSTRLAQTTLPDNHVFLILCVCVFVFIPPLYLIVHTRRSRRRSHSSKSTVVSISQLYAKEAEDNKDPDEDEAISHQAHTEPPLQQPSNLSAQTLLQSILDHPSMRLRDSSSFSPFTTTITPNRKSKPYHRVRWADPPITSTLESSPQADLWRWARKNVRYTEDDDQGRLINWENRPRVGGSVGEGSRSGSSEQ